MRQRFKIVLPVGMLTLIAVALLSLWSIYHLREAIRYERQSYAVQANVDDLFELVQGAESSQRGYLITGKDEYLETYLRTVPRIPGAFEKLKLSVRGLPLRDGQLTELESLLDRKLHEIKQTVILQQSEKEDDALALFQAERGETLMASLHAALDEIDLLASRAAARHEGFVRSYGTLLNIAIAVGSLATLALVLVFAFYSREEIRQRMRNEHELRSAQDAALVASKLKSQFLATVSHEIRTPLNGIIGMSDLLRVRLQEPELRRFVDIIHNSGNALLKIVNDILDFSKIEAGKVDFEFSEFSVLDIVESTSDLFAARAREKGLRLYSFVDSNLPTSVLGDVSRTSQILRNLISNAIKFTESGGVLVRARLRFQSGSKTMIRFEVQDTGMGISSESRKLLFQPFNQVGKGESHEAGTGLGLSICKDLVVNMGGQIDLESHEGQGSTFWFELPLKDLSHKNFAEPVVSHPEVKMVICFSQSPLLDQVVALYSTDLHFDARCVEGLDQETKSLIRATSAIVVIDVDGRSPSEMQQLIAFAHEAGASSVTLLERSQLDDLPRDLDKSGVSRVLGSPFRREQWIGILKNEHTDVSEIVTKEVESNANLNANAPLILLVEDNQTNQLVASLTLHQLGYRVHTVANGKEALEALERISYETVLMDCQMPEMDGFEATRIIRERERATGQHVPIIAMTANALASDKEKCLSAGMDGFLAKPFQPADLNRVIQELLSPGSRRLVDWSVLHQLAQKTNETVVAKLIQSFLKTLPASLSEIEAARANKDTERLRSWAHQLKSSCGTLGALELQTLCSRLEAAIEKGEPYDSIDSIAGSLIEKGQGAVEIYQSQTRYERL